MKLLKMLIPAIALFVVAAFGLTGCGGGGGGSTPAPTPAATVPAAPTGVVATGGSTQVSLAWTAVSGATSYNVYWSNSTGVTTATGTKVTGVANPFVQTGLAFDADYYYVVTAVNAAGESVASAEAHGHTNPLPAGPVVTSATPSATAVTLTWTAVTGATSYNVYFSTSSAVSSSVNDGAVVPATSGTPITGLNPTTTYFFAVTAIVGGVETNPTVVSAKTSATPAPSFVSGVTVTSLNFGGGNPGYRVQWAAVSGATGYNIYYSSFNNITINGAGVTKAIASATEITNLSKTINLPTGSYFFVVTAVNANGESTLSSEVNGLPPLFTDSLVSGKTVTYTDATGSFSFVANAPVGLADGTITFVSSTLPGVTTGTGTWNTTGGELNVVINPTPTNLSYLLFSLKGSSQAGVTMTQNGVTSGVSGTITIN